MLFCQTSKSSNPSPLPTSLLPFAFHLFYFSPFRLSPFAFHLSLFAFVYYATEQIEQRHLQQRTTAGLRQRRVGYHDGETLRPRERHIESMLVEQKLQTSR